MRQNIQITPFGGILNDLTPRILLNGYDNIVIDLKGLDYEKNFENKNGSLIIKDAFQDVSFSFYNAKNGQSLELLNSDILLSFLVYDSYINTNIKPKAYQFNGYVKKLEYTTLNTYKLTIKRISPLYIVDVLSFRESDLKRFPSMQEAYKALEPTFMKAQELTELDWKFPYFIDKYTTLDNEEVYVFKTATKQNVLYITADSQIGERLALFWRAKGQTPTYKVEDMQTSQEIASTTVCYNDFSVSTTVYGTMELKELRRDFFVSIFNNYGGEELCFVNFKKSKIYGLAFEKL